jgi:hypothetical protein
MGSLFSLKNWCRKWQPVFSEASLQSPRMVGERNAAERQMPRFRARKCQATLLGALGGRARHEAGQLGYFPPRNPFSSAHDASLAELSPPRAAAKRALNICAPELPGVSM